MEEKVKSKDTIPFHFHFCIFLSVFVTLLSCQNNVNILFKNQKTRTFNTLQTTIKYLSPRYVLNDKIYFESTYNGLLIYDIEKDEVEAIGAENSLSFLLKISSNGENIVFWSCKNSGKRYSNEFYIYCYDLKTNETTVLKKYEYYFPFNLVNTEVLSEISHRFRASLNILTFDLQKDSLSLTFNANQFTSHYQIIPTEELPVPSIYAYNYRSNAIKEIFNGKKYNRKSIYLKELVFIPNGFPVVGFPHYECYGNSVYLKFDQQSKKQSGSSIFKIPLNNVGDRSKIIYELPYGSMYLNFYITDNKLNILYAVKDKKAQSNLFLTVIDLNTEKILNESKIVDLNKLEFWNEYLEERKDEIENYKGFLKDDLIY